ncbi:Glucitol operon repressor [Thalassocella blandensis]|nr:Glucitol operon repressor [Thalassocella blandensis]
MRDTSERREQIARMLKEKGSVQVLGLTSMFDVSGVTIRKDLRFLENQGIAVRMYGGAILNDASLNETSTADSESALDRKQTLHIEEKAHVGKLASSLVNDGDSILLDSGSTTLHLASCLGDKEDITVVTNSLNIVFELLPYKQIEVMLLGGSLRRKSESFFGTSAMSTLRDLHVDKLFLGVDGFHMERGITTHFEAEAQLNRLMCEVASQIIVVTDSSKFGNVCLHKIIEPSGVDKIVTDSKIPNDYLQGLESMGIDVLRVEP